MFRAFAQDAGPYMYARRQAIESQFVKLAYNKTELDIFQAIGEGVALNSKAESSPIQLHLLLQGRQVVLKGGGPQRPKREVSETTIDKAENHVEDLLKVNQQGQKCNKQGGLPAVPRV